MKDKIKNYFKNLWLKIKSKPFQFAFSLLILFLCCAMLIFIFTAPRYVKFASADELQPPSSTYIPDKPSPVSPDFPDDFYVNYPHEFNLKYLFQPSISTGSNMGSLVPFSVVHSVDFNFPYSSLPSELFLGFFISTPSGLSAFFPDQYYFEIDDNEVHFGLRSSTVGTEFEFILSYIILNSYEFYHLTSISTTVLNYSIYLGDIYYSSTPPTASSISLVNFIFNIFNSSLWLDGYNVGFLQGVENSGDNSYDRGYQNGYNDGYNQGYNVGYSAGSDTTFNPVGMVINPVAQLLSTPLFGNFSIGSFFTVALFVSVALIFLRIFAGG